ncbi:MAG: hypothetical protein ABSH50_22915 [Bryobacteraceae bacterium]
MGRRSKSHKFNTHLAYYPDDKPIVIVLGNLNGHPEQIAEKLASVIFQK